MVHRSIISGLMLFVQVSFFYVNVYANPLQIETKSLLISRSGQGFVSVVNTSDKVEYFRVIVRRVLVDDDGYVSTVSKKNPRDLGLLVVPVNLKMAPLQKRKLRVVSLMKKKVDDLPDDALVYYHIDFDHLTKEELDRAKEIENMPARSSGMGFYIDAKTERRTLVAVGRRDDFKPETTARIESYEKKSDNGTVNTGRQLVITNSGNVALWLTGFVTCDRSNQCDGLTWFKMLYPGERYHHPIKDKDYKIEYVERFGSSRKKRVVLVSS